MKSRAPIVAVGTVFVDLKCFPQHELNFKGRNPGISRFFHGGVGRNVAETMALLGSPVRFASSVQDGGVGQEVLERLRQAGVDTAGINVVNSPDGHGMWVAILHRDGDLACSISQMPNVAHMEDAWRRHGKRLLDGAGIAVLEVDLSDRLADWVLADAAAADVPVVGLPGNFECIRKRPDLLPKLHTFVCNQYEAEELCGKPVASIPAARQAAKVVLERGMQQVVVTVGALGSVAAAHDMEPVHVPALPVEVVDTTGAGDAFVAGLSHAIAVGAPLHLAVQAATRVAAWTVN
ncbi:MAG: psuK, partial [Firmicutes bacterium]|nr:psuK [Bacillota bacterium]